MATLDFVPTIEDDEVVAGAEDAGSDSETEMVARKGQKKQTEFAEGFEFPVDGGERITWDMNEAMDMAIKGQPSQFTPLDVKIARVREMRN